jgi:hypothetical protein
MLAHFHVLEIGSFTHRPSAVNCVYLGTPDILL